MPLYFFHMKVDGIDLTDDDGILLPDPEAARREGFAALFAVAADADSHISARRITLRVATEGDRQVFMMSLDFSYTE